MQRLEVSGVVRLIYRSLGVKRLKIWGFHGSADFYSALWSRGTVVDPATWSNKGKALPLQAWSGPEGSRKLRFLDYMTTAEDGGKVVSLTHRPPLPPGNASGTHFCYSLSRPQGHSAIRRILCQWKNPMTPTGIEPATFRFVAQHFNHCATAVPPMR